jgi:hypothetical protein
MLAVRMLSETRREPILGGLQAASMQPTVSENIHTATLNMRLFTQQLIASTKPSILFSLSPKIVI